MINDNKTPVLLFDGVCNLCVGSVQFFLKNDRKKLLKFASLQSAYGEKKKEELNIPQHIDSLILVEGSKYYNYSSAALKAAGHMGGIWSLSKIFLVLPLFIRDNVYKWIARNRYHWFGKKESCWLPTPEILSRFLDNETK